MSLLLPKVGLVRFGSGRHREEISGRTNDPYMAGSLTTPGWFRAYSPHLDVGLLALPRRVFARHW